jgi:hypothetical protein
MAMRKCIDKGLQINHEEKVIERTKSKCDVGNSTLGVLDYLWKEHGFAYVNSVRPQDETWA